MEPCYFGSGDKRLFGIHHPPARVATRQSGVVLCYPMGYEYFRAHRAFLQLARRLAEAGFHVLRFDYYGCGDSGGESDEGEAGRWMENIAAAIDEMKDFSGAAKVSLVGARLGATLAALAGSRRADVQSIVLWDPIVDGKDYLRELAGRHEEWLREMLPNPAKANGGSKIPEVMGFPLTAALRDGLEKIDLSAVENALSKRIFIVESIAPSVTLRWRERMKTAGAPSDYEHVPGASLWLGVRERSQALVPAPILRSIVGWLAEVSP